MRVIFTGGGTGGHIYPAIALIQEMKSRDLDLEILYVGTETGMEKRLIGQMGLPYKTVRVKGLPRKINREFFSSLNTLRKGLGDAKKIIRDFNPDLAIGTGGYVSGPTLFQASKTDCKTLIHEQNSYPGITNKILSRFVDLVCITFESSKKYFKDERKLRLTGNPIRNDFKSQAEDSDYDFFGLRKDLPVVFSFGGSNGSASLNSSIKALAARIGKSDFQLIHVTGRDNYDSFMEGFEGYENIHIYPYMDNMVSAYAVSDLIIASSGAITLAEISHVGLASILIPKAYTTENHQEYNARSYVESGASSMILEKDLGPDLLYEEIEKIIKDPQKLSSMADNSRKMGNDRAAKDIIDLALSLLED